MHKIRESYATLGAIKTAVDFIHVLKFTIYLHAVCEIEQESYSVNELVDRGLNQFH